MSDLKLFKLASDHVTEMPVSSMALEKSLQSLIEKYLDTFLGITFLASEFSTSPKTGERMETLGVFLVVKRKYEAKHGTYRTQSLPLEGWDRISA